MEGKVQVLDVTPSWSPFRAQLTTSCRLEYMDLTGNNITDDGALMVCECWATWILMTCQCCRSYEL